MTVISDRAAQPEPWFSKPGTTAPTATMAPGKQFICTLLMAGAAASTLSIVTPSDALAMRSVVESRTLPALPATPPAADTSVSVASILQRLRRASGLGWGDISAALGVSRRTIHNWLGGARVAGLHLVRLIEFDLLVKALDTGSADDTRALLMQVGDHGRSQLADLALAARPRRTVPLSSVSVADLVTPVEDGAAAAAQPPQRRSSVRGGPLARRRPAGS